MTFWKGAAQAAVGGLLAAGVWTLGGWAWRQLRTSTPAPAPNTGFFPTGANVPTLAQSDVMPMWKGF